MTAPDRAPHDRSLVVALVSLVALLGLLALLRSRMVGWDEAVYLGMGKFLYSGGRSGLWELFRPPLVPLLDGACWRAGLDLVDASRVIAVLFAAAYLTMTFRIAREVVGEAGGLMAAGLCLATPLFLKYATMTLTDIPSMSLVLCAIHLAQRDRPALAGAATGAAFLAKFTQLIVALPLALFIGLARRDPKRAARYLGGLLIALLGFVGFSIAMHGRELGWWGAIIRPVQDAMLFQSVSSHLPSATLEQKLANFLHHPRTLIASSVGSILFALAPGAVLLPAEPRRKLGVVVSVLAVVLLYYGMVAHQPERFALFLLPFAAILTAAVALHLVRRVRSRSRAVFVGLALGAALLPALRHDVQLVREPVGPTREQQRELFGYFAARAVAGPILTASPLFSVYSDQRYIPVYNTVGSDHTYVNDWEVGMRANAAAYSDAGFDCRDRPCFERRQRLAAAIDSTLTLEDVLLGFGEKWFFFVGRREDEKR